MDTTTAAHGRWREILPSLGVPSAVLNGKNQPCPFCGGTDRYRFTNRSLDGDYFCNQCGAGKGLSFLMRFHGWTFKQAADEVDKIIDNLPEPKPIRTVHVITTEDVARIWGDTKEIDAGDPVDKYLTSREIKMRAKDLRYAPIWKHSPTQKYLPCMMALFRDPKGEVGTLHRTYLADVQPRRMFLPRPIARGGAIRLGVAHEIMGVAEGIETALSASQIFGMSVWATTSERLLREWEPPPEAKQITVFGDNDENYIGHAAAYHLANRLVLRGYDVKVEIPNILGWDWNDALKVKERWAPAEYPEPPLQPIRHTDIQA